MKKLILRSSVIISLIAMQISFARAEEPEKPDAATQKIYQAAELLRKEGKNGEAETLLTKAIAEGNNHIILRMGLAVTYATEKNYEKASECYREVWKRSGNVPMLESYAVSLAQLKDWDKLREIVEDLVGNFDKLKEGRLAVFMVAATDSNQNLFNRAIAKIPVEDIRQDKELASILALTSKKLAEDRLNEKK